jgi:hypothetical protein
MLQYNIIEQEVGCAPGSVWTCGDEINIGPAEIRTLEGQPISRHYTDCAV